MKIRFIHGFRGRETNERYYEAGEIAELEQDLAALLVRDGRAVPVKDAPTEALKRAVVKRERKKP